MNIFQYSVLIYLSIFKQILQVVNNIGAHTCIYRVLCYWQGCLIKNPLAEIPKIRYSPLYHFRFQRIITMTGCYYLWQLRFSNLPNLHEIELFFKLFYCIAVASHQENDGLSQGMEHRCWELENLHWWRWQHSDGIHIQAPWVFQRIAFTTATIIRCS